MRIRQLSIRNFRGIREMDWALPCGNVLCLIGRGDSMKSTILEAVRRAFHPQWNLSFSDADFYRCNPDVPIIIDVVLGELPAEFKDLGRYGYLLCGWNPNQRVRTEEPGEGLEDALWIRLKVAKDLEPSWRVIRDEEDDGKDFKASDRQKVAVSLIGSYADRHLTWSKGSILSQVTNAENISASLAGAARAAKAALDRCRGDVLTSFDAAAHSAENVAKALGVPVADTFKAHLDLESINVKLGGLALHDGDIPARQLGLGSRRILTSALQKQALVNPHITLFDEVESGLEPHRIARLLKHLKEDNTGQYFLTTHSPVVLRELTVKDLFVTRCTNGQTELVSANRPNIADSLQGKIREGAEAFLAAKIVVCEGATEVGFLRGLDDCWITQGKASFAYQGVACYNAAGASKVKATAEDVAELGYEVSVLVDGDAQDKFSDTDAAALTARGIPVVMWADTASIEERAFADLPWSAVLNSVSLAQTIGGADRVLGQIESQYGQGFQRDHELWIDTRELRKAIGAAAKHKDNGWFKQISLAEEWARLVGPSLERPEISATDFAQKLIHVRTWIDHV